MIRNKQTAAAVGALLAGIVLGSALQPGLAAGMQTGGGPSKLAPRTDLPIIQVYEDPNVPRQEKPQASRDSGSASGFQPQPRPSFRPSESGHRSGSMGMGSSRSRPSRGGDYGGMGMEPGYSPGFGLSDTQGPGATFPFGGGSGQWPQAGLSQSPSELGGAESGPAPGGRLPPVTSPSGPGWSGYVPSEGFGQSPSVPQPAWEAGAATVPGDLQVPEMGYAPGGWTSYPPTAGAGAGSGLGPLPPQMPSYPPARFMGRSPWGLGSPPVPFGPPQMGLERQTQIEERLERIEASLQEILENQRRILSRE